MWARVIHLVWIIHCDFAQAVAPQTDDRTPRFVQLGPRCPVSAQAKRPMEVEGTGLLRRHPPHRPEPDSQGLTRALENGSGLH